MDSVGIWTVGYGSTHDVHPGEPISQAEAESRLAEDVSHAEVAVNAAVEVPLTQGEFDALVSIVFNVGPGLKGKKDGIIKLKNGEPSTMLKLLNEGDYDGAANQFRRWDRAGGQVLSGLSKRRYAEFKLFESTPT